MRTLVWHNGADLDPATMHGRPAYEHVMRGMDRARRACEGLKVRPIALAEYVSR